MARAGPVQIVAGGFSPGVRETELAIERVERGQLRAELELELGRVDPLALGVEQPLLEQRQLVLQVLVGEPQVVPFDRNVIALGGEVIALCEVGVRNGPTIKPIELRVGIIEGMTPDMARIVGELGAEAGSRSVMKTLRVTGLAAPGRAFLAKRTTRMAVEIAAEIEPLEQAAREAEPVPEQVGSVSCGMDRMAVRMSELADPDQHVPATRDQPYVRTPPFEKAHHYRMAWVGSTTSYDKAGAELQTWRYAIEASADPDVLTRRVAKDVAWVVGAHRDVPVHCVQDGAPELRALPEALGRALPATTIPMVLVDFEHLMGYLDRVVDACEPEGDPHHWKRWYRGSLLRDDAAIDTIWRKLRRLADRLDGRGTAARDAVAAALSYIRRRKAKMRYASHYAAKLPIGSGATASTCWQMQQRVKQPGQSWEVGLGGVLATRGLALSHRWAAAWQPYAAKHQREVRAFA